MKIKIALFMMLLVVRAFFVIETSDLDSLGYCEILCESRDGVAKIEEISKKYPLEKAFILLPETTDGQYSIMGNFELIKKDENRSYYKVKNLIKKEKKKIFFLRSYFQNRLERILENENIEIKNFFKGVVLGENRFIHRELRSKFSYTGSSHLLAVSGLHFGLLVFMIVKLLEKIHISKGYRHLLEFFFLTAYMIGISSSASSLRAYIMGSMIIFSKFFYEENSVRKSFNIAFGISLFIDPLNIFDTSFQMSYLAVFTILYIVPKFNLIWTGVLIQIFLTPIMLLIFKQLPLFAFLANFILIPFGSFLISLCFMAFILSFIELHRIVLPVIRIIYTLFTYILSKLSEIPMLSVKVDLKIDWRDIVIMYITLLIVVFLPELCYSLRRYSKSRRKKL